MKIGAVTDGALALRHALGKQKPEFGLKSIAVIAPILLDRG